MERIEPDMVQQQSAKSLALYSWEHDEILTVFFLLLFLVLERKKIWSKLVGR